MHRLKDLVLTGLHVPGIAAPLQWLLRDRAAVFMLHRFADPARGVRGLEPDLLRNGLAWLREHGYQLLPLREVVRRLAEDGASLRRAVAFTIDDGYYDQAEIAGPVFAEFDCPVTTFVCTGFLDGEHWMWWDRIEHVFAHTERTSLRVPLGAAEWDAEWTDDAGRQRAQHEFTERCKRVPDAEKQAAIERLARAAELDLPGAPPPAYAPMTWDQLRACERRGMRFGPHTRTHPVLSQTTPDQARREIAGSQERLARESADVERVFCYPNGQLGDFGPREFEILADLGFEAAVVGYPGYASRFDSGSVERFALRRFSFSDRLEDVVQCVTGFERLKELVRGLAVKPLGRLLDLAGRLRRGLETKRLERRWETLRALGMQIGEDVLLPASTWIDVSHCYLISIGDHTGFGENCQILAHDAQMDEFLDAARIGRVVIRESCHIGANTVILSGVEMGPRTIVGAGSIVSRSLPADSVCAGNPAKVIAPLEDYLARHRTRLSERPRFDYARYDIHTLTPERRAEILAAVAEGDAYIVGGRSAELAGTGGSQRTGPRGRS